MLMKANGNEFHDLEDGLDIRPKVSDLLLLRAVMYRTIL